MKSHGLLGDTKSLRNHQISKDINMQQHAFTSSENTIKLWPQVHPNTITYNQKIYNKSIKFSYKNYRANEGVGNSWFCTVVVVSSQ